MGGKGGMEYFYGGEGGNGKLLWGGRGRVTWFSGERRGNQPSPTKWECRKLTAD